LKHYLLIIIFITYLLGFYLVRCPRRSIRTLVRTDLEHRLGHGLEVAMADLLALDVRAA
jgi:hypothetical protein